MTRITGRLPSTAFILMMACTSMCREAHGVPVTLIFLIHPGAATGEV